MRTSFPVFSSNSDSSNILLPPEPQTVRENTLQCSWSLQCREFKLEAAPGALVCSRQMVGRNLPAIPCIAQES